MGHEMNSQERIMRIVEILAGKELMGMLNKDIALKLKVSAVAVCRDIAILHKLDWVEAAPQGGYRLTPHFAEFSKTIARGFQQARLNLTTEEDRYSGSKGRAI